METMARWEPDARGRLEKAAMELFQERGYGPTTVEEIAARAGLTERTFFRYFADKREVLFSGSKELEKSIVLGIESAPSKASPMGAVALAFEAAGARLEELRDIRFVRARYALVTNHAEIQERELIKMASLAGAVTRALHARGVSEPAASLAAELGIAVFKIGFERWVGKKKPRGLAAHVRATMGVLRVIAAEGKRPKNKPSRRAK
jgi:AcrR family transcriptional regulator